VTELDQEPGVERVVLDTNVLVSALLTPAGNPSAVLRAALDGELTLVFSVAIIAEYRSVLARPRFGFDPSDIDDLMAFIEAFGQIVSPMASGVSLLDESDRPFFDACEAAAATLVTGNTRHYPRSCRMMTPAEFVRRLRKTLGWDTPDEVLAKLLEDKS